MPSRSTSKAAKPRGHALPPPHPPTPAERREGEVEGGVATARAPRPSPPIPCCPATQPARSQAARHLWLQFF